MQPIWPDRDASERHVQHRAHRDAYRLSVERIAAAGRQQDGARPECRGGAVNTFYVHPSDFGLPKASPAQLRGGDASANADIARAILRGEKGAARDIVLVNAAAALLIAGHAPAIAEGVQQAAAAIDSGEAARRLETLVRVSNEGSGAKPS